MWINQLLQMNVGSLVGEQLEDTVLCVLLQFTGWRADMVCSIACEDIVTEPA
jgi:hypothetical protein